jgi:hypothetical protein
MRLLHGAGQVVQVGVLHDDGDVDAVGAQRLAKRGQAALDLVARHRHGTRLDERRRQRCRVLGVRLRGGHSQGMKAPSVAVSTFQ